MSGRFEEEKNFLSLHQFEHRTVQPIASRYTDYPIPAATVKMSYNDTRYDKLQVTDVLLGPNCSCIDCYWKQDKQLFLSLHRAFCSLFNYAHQYMHIYRVAEKSPYTQKIRTSDSI